MTATEAVTLIRRVGVVEKSGGNLKVRFPEEQREVLQPVIDVLRSCKAEALELLADPSNNLGFTAAPPESAGPLESGLEDRAIELWSTRAGRLFLVADSEDAIWAMTRLRARRGEIYTSAEIRRIVSVRDPAVVSEIHEWKRRFDCTIPG